MSKIATQKGLAAIASSLIVLRRRRRRRRNRTVWCKPWLLLGEEKGAYSNIMTELEQGDQSAFENYLRMDVAAFNDLLLKVAPSISKRDTKFRKSISARERLAITLRYLATGETYRSLSYQFRVGSTTIGEIVPETCEAIYHCLQEEFMKAPASPEEWKEVAANFQERWNFPNCIGALDGKHIVIKPPAHSGSTFFNYKHTHSIVLMALVDANYEFLYVDVGTNGRISDGGVFNHCTLGQSLQNNTLNLPIPSPLPHTNILSPFTIVGDDAFPLKENIMKPYPFRKMSTEQRIFNYRLSRARRVVENAFGILANRFQVFQSPINLSPDTVETIVLAACVLHNYLRRNKSSRDLYTPPGSLDREVAESHELIPGAWRNDEGGSGLAPLQADHARNYSVNAKSIRDNLCNYFNSEEGEVLWQYNLL